MSRQERIIVFLLASLNFTHMLDFMIMMPLDNYLIPVFHISPRQFSFLVGAYSLAAAVSGFVAAFIVDKFDRKTVLLVAYSGFVAGTIACGVARSYDLLMVCRILTGVFGGLIGAQVFSIIGDLFAYERRGMAMGAVMSSFAVAATVGVPFSLYLTNLFHYNWHVPFLLVGGIGLVLIPIIIKYLPPVKSHLELSKSGDSPFEALTQVLSSPTQFLALIFTMLMMVGHFLIIPFLNPYMEFNMGFSKNQTPIIYLVGGITSFLAAVVLGRLSDKHGKLRVFSISVLLSLVMVWAITNMPIVPFSVVLCFFAVWFILGTGRGVTAQAMVSNVVRPEQRGSFMTFNSSMQQLGTFIASIVAGYIVIEDKTKSGRIHRFDWLGYLSIAVLFLSYVLARKLFGKMDKGEVVVEKSE
jgi:MFS transporter, DHA1 family, inner membrane transport protein